MIAAKQAGVWKVRAVVLAAGVTLAACGGGGGQRVVCDVVSKAAQRCGVVEQYGAIGANMGLVCSSLPEGSDFIECIEGCYETSSCSDITELLCGGVFPIELDSCLLACNQAGFECGSGEIVWTAWACDGFDDCDDGSDELECTRFECSNGGSISSAWACDGWDDCGDNSDEEECLALNCVESFAGSSSPAPVTLEHGRASAGSGQESGERE